VNDPLALLTIALGLLVRFGLPLATLALVIVVLRRLDARWQAEGQRRVAQPVTVAGAHCWEMRGCSEATRAICPAALNPDTACWQHFRDRDGNLRAGCLVCEFFRAVPAPEPAPARRLS
jgi:hypothetical protein